MALNARILILAHGEASCDTVAEGLDRLGWRTITSRSGPAAEVAVQDLQLEAVIICDPTQWPDAGRLIARLRAAAWPRRLPFLALSPQGGEASAYGDLTLPPEAPAVQIALRLEQLIRMAVAEEEFALRRETFAERGAVLEDPTEGETPVSVLTIGSPAPQFLALSNALQSSGAEVVGAFTAYTAFDYLHERAFDAVVLWGGDDQGEALAITAGMRRNTRLYHLPTILYLRAAADANASDLFSRGVTDLASPESDEMETGERVISLARSYRRQTAIRRALEKARGSGLMDKGSGLFTRDLFAAHMVRLAQAARERNRPLSVCVLRLADRPETVRARSGGWLDSAMPQIGSMIARLVRAEDTAARLAPEVFALALPATQLGQARLVADRITAVIGCTAFDSGPGHPPFVVEFEVGVGQVEPGESAGRALERAASATAERAAS